MLSELPTLQPIGQPSREFKSPVYKPTRDAKSTSKKRRRRIRYGRVAVALSVFCFLLYACVSLICSFVVWLFTPSSSVFSGIMPAKCSLAVEGNKDKVQQFVANWNVSSLTGLPVKSLSQLPGQRVMLAVTPALDVTASKECVGNVGKIVDVIENEWNAQSSYPINLPPIPQCPVGGQLSYQSDGDSFKLVCRASNHATVYDSNEGVAQGNEIPQTIVAFEPDPHSQPFPGSFTVPGIDHLAFLAVNKEKAIASLEGVQKASVGLELPGSAQPNLRFSITQSELNQFFPYLASLLPKFDRITVSNEEGSSLYSVRMSLLEQPKIDNSVDVEGVLNDLPSSSTTYASSVDFLQFLSFRPSELEAKVKPKVLGVSLSQVFPINDMMSVLIKSLAGRTTSELLVAFDSEKEAKEWSANSLWAQEEKDPENNPFFKLSFRDNQIKVQAGDPLETKQKPILPKALDNTLMAGWVTVQESTGGLITYAFNAGIQGKELWMEIDQQALEEKKNEKN